MFVLILNYDNRLYLLNQRFFRIGSDVSRNNSIWCDNIYLVFCYDGDRLSVRCAKGEITINGVDQPALTRIFLDNSCFIVANGTVWFDFVNSVFFFKLIHAYILLFFSVVSFFLLVNLNILPRRKRFLPSSCIW